MAPRRHTTEEFISRANLIHNFKYDYSKTVYVKSKARVTIICPIHNCEFTPTPHNHLINHTGCPECGWVTHTNQKRDTQQSFIDKANDRHKFKYGYENVKYIDARTKVEIVCELHGPFYQQPQDHIHGNGCPSCKTSKGECAIKTYLESNNIQFEQGHHFEKRCRNPISNYPLPFDFYLPNANMCIEFDGKQHYEPSSFSSDKSVETMEQNLIDIKFRDAIKDKFCEDNGIALLRIKYTNLKKVPRILDRSLMSARLTFAQPEYKQYIAIVDAVHDP